MTEPEPIPDVPRPRAVSTGCLIVAFVFGVWLLLMWPKLRGAKGAARRAQCKYNLKTIGLALHAYHDEFDSFPPAYVADESGRPLYSWRVLAARSANAYWRAVDSRCSST